VVKRCYHFCRTKLDAGPDGIRYDWSTGSTDRSINVNTAGKYIVEVEDEYGCIKSDSVIISMSISPSIYIGDDTTICVNSPTVISAPPGFELYEWNTGSTEQSITTILQGGYKVQVTDEYGLLCYGVFTMG